MAKDYSERTKALDDIFKKLMVNSGITPAGADTVEVIKGTKREQWAFPQDGSAGINVTPFQDRAPAEQKILGDLFDKMYGHGASYETAGAHKNAADAMAAQAAAAMKGAQNEADRFNFLKKELEKKLAATGEATDGAAGNGDYVGMPPWAEKVPKPGTPVLGGAVAAPSAARTTGYGPGKPGGVYDFNMTPEKMNQLGVKFDNTPQKKKKTNTGNPWLDQGFSEFSTLGK
jgi:hypothetical protein